MNELININFYLTVFNNLTCNSLLVVRPFVRNPISLSVLKMSIQNM